MNCANFTLSLTYFQMVLQLYLCNVHSFVMACLGNCLSLYLGISSQWFTCLDHFPCAVAFLIGIIPKFIHISSSILEVLYWLTVHRVQGHLHGVVVPVRPHFNLPNWPFLGILSSWTLLSVGKRALSALFACATIMWCLWVGILKGHYINFDWCEAMLFLYWAQQYGMIFLLSCTSSLRHFLTHSIITWRLFLLTMLKLVAPVKGVI